MSISNFGNVDDLTDEQIAEFKEAFQIYDKDSDGLINLEELETVLRSLGSNIAEHKLKTFFQSLDLEENGSISFKEFLILMASQVNDVIEESDLIDAFKTFDPENSGKISAQELRTLLMSCPEFRDDSEIQDILEQADVEKTGQVDYYEFIKLVNSSCK